LAEFINLKIRGLDLLKGIPMQHGITFELVTTALTGLLLGWAIWTFFFPSHMSPQERRYRALMLLGSAAVASGFIPAAAVGVVLVLFSVIKLGRIPRGERLQR
jgi:hypothetical protein